MSIDSDTIVISEPTIWSNADYNVTGTILFRSNLTIIGTPKQPVRVFFANPSSILRVYGPFVQLQDVEFYSARGFDELGCNWEGGIGLSIDSGEQETRIEAKRLTCRLMGNCLSGSKGSTFDVSDSVFIENRYALESVTGTVEHSLFLNNTGTALTYSEYYSSFVNVVANSMFAHNNEGIGRFGRIVVENTTFVGNYWAVRGSRQLKDVLFYRNQFASSGWSSAEGVTFRDNSIAITTEYTFGGDFERPELNFIGNDIHIDYRNPSILELKNIYWGTTNVTEIRNHIHDVYQYTYSGLIEIEPIATEPFQSSSLSLPEDTFLGYTVFDASSYTPTTSPHSGESASPVPTTHFTGTIDPSLPLPGSSNFPSFAPTRYPTIGLAESPSQAPTKIPSMSPLENKLSPQPITNQPTNPNKSEHLITPSHSPHVTASLRPSMSLLSTEPSSSPTTNPSNEPTQLRQSGSPVSSQSEWKSQTPSMAPSVDLFAICRQQFSCQLEASPKKTNPLLVVSLTTNALFFAFIGFFLAQKVLRQGRS